PSLQPLATTVTRRHGQSPPAPPSLSAGMVSCRTMCLGTPKPPSSPGTLAPASKHVYLPAFSMKTRKYGTCAGLCAGSRRPNLGSQWHRNHTVQHHAPPVPCAASMERLVVIEPPLLYYPYAPTLSSPGPEHRGQQIRRLAFRQSRPCCQTELAQQCHLLLR